MILRSRLASIQVPRIYRVCAMEKSASWRMLIPTVLILRPCCVLCLCAIFGPWFSAGHVYAAMPPLYRIDVGKDVFYALDDHEKKGTLDRIAAEKLKGKLSVQRFKGLGEMNPLQLRETTIAPDTRRLVRLVVEPGDATDKTMDMLLSKKRASDRKQWLEKRGDLAES